MKKILVFLFFITVKASAQDAKLSPLTISGYAEGYYNYDFNNHDHHVIAPFIYSNQKANQVNLNLV